MWSSSPTLDIMEVFVGRGSSGGCEKNLTAMARLISAGLRGGIHMDYILDQLKSCGGCSAYMTRKATKKDTSPGSSCATAIAIALRDIQKSIGKVSVAVEKPSHAIPKAEYQNPVCPECGEELVVEGGCNVCKNCGWSKCG